MAPLSLGGPAQALRNGAPFTELPESFRRLQSKLLKRPGGDREMVDILALVLLHDKQLVEQAVAAVLARAKPTWRHPLPLKPSSITAT